MRTLAALLLLSVFGSLAGVATFFVLNIAGWPGALIAGKPSRKTRGRFFTGFCIAALGQSYVYLGFVAFVVNWTANRDGVNGWLVWPVAFFAAWLPVHSCSIVALQEAREVGFTNAQVEALFLTSLLAIAGFFVFAFAPRVSRSVWPWAIS